MGSIAKLLPFLPQSRTQQTPLFELTQIAFPLSEYSNILFIY